MPAMLIDLIPVLLFFVAFKIYGIYVATTVGIVATAAQVIFTRLTRRYFDKQQVVTLVVFSLFGGMTLYFHDPIFVKWKPSIVFWVFGLVFFFSHFFGKKPLAQRMLEHMLEAQANTIPLFVWKRVNFAWALFFITLGFVNIYIAYNFTTDAWVNFKVYGLTGMIFIFSIAQAFCLSRYLPETKQ